MVEIIIGMLILPVAKYIIGARVGKWLDRQIEAQPAKYARYKTIWSHYMDGQNHDAQNVLDCRNTTCAAL